MRSSRVASMRGTAVFAIALFTAAAVAACGTARKVAETKQRSLATFVLKASEAPPGTRYAPQTSGPGTLERQGLSMRSLQQLRSFGFESDYGRQFYGTKPRKGITSASSIAARFRSSDGAAKGLRFLERRLLDQHPQVKPVSTSGLGDEGWAYGG